jgi:hypothetical protein
MILRPLAKCGLRPTSPIVHRAPAWRYHEPGDDPSRDIVAHGWVRETVVHNLAAFLDLPDDVVTLRVTEEAPHGQS